MLTRKLVLLFALLLPASLAFAADRMPLEQVQKGMKGYGLTVFEGTAIEKFDVEILGVLNNIGPGQNLILAKVDSPVIRRTGIIAGMSGSPVFIDGKVIGALAYAWQFAKEPVAGITPIEEMLKIAQRMAPAGATLADASPRMSGAELLQTIVDRKLDGALEKMVNELAGHPVSSVSGAKRIALPISLSSFAPETVARFSPQLESLGFVAVPSGATSASTTGGRTSRPPSRADETSALPSKKDFAPGDPVGAVLLNGDFTVAASGTVTYIDGNRVYAFGHPFLDMGEISFPMATSEVVTVLPSLASSFKFSNTGPVVGVLRQDRAAGIMGILGESAQLIPVEVTLNGSGAVHTYRANVVRHSRLSPLMLAMVTDSVIANAQRAAGERTVLLDSEIRLKGFAEPVRLREGWAGEQARSSIPAYLAIVSGYLMSNEFRDAEVESVKVHIRHDDQLRIAKLMEASLVMPEKGYINPGDTVKVRTVLKPFRGEPFIETFDIRIPDDQPAGSAHLLIGSGSVMNAVDFTLVPPDPRTLEQVLGVLQRLRPSTDLTVGLYTNHEGAVTSGVYLPNLPPSMRAVVSGDTSNGAKAPVKYHRGGQQARSLGYIVDGALKIDLDVRPQI
ncbi:MAG TPA: SpoIVB peptidase S55 domain-containing protein [Thermoanaerobaculia bacterium]|nr:SpoIVB peptidase S55 domain-containing protein [Thermoanaerobaculia bacterium]